MFRCPRGDHGNGSWLMCVAGCYGIYHPWMGAEEKTMKLGTVIATGKEGVFCGPYSSQIRDIRIPEDVHGLAEAARRIGIDIIYLDAYRSGVLESADKMQWIKEEFTREGFDVRGSAALGIASGEFSQPAVTREAGPGEFEMGFLDCWAHERTWRGYRAISERLAEVFDRVLPFQDQAMEGHHEGRGHRPGPRDKPRYRTDCQAPPMA